ncbi:hypothetical protein J4217_03440 [Candidatus Pacearchaeota archaeon]|nr:hypothetical protein [Candidatus Pacearchaeota archaeon]
MAKLTAWIVTILGVLLLLPLLGVGSATEGVIGWLLAIGVLVVGIGKLTRNYGKRRR